jgi:hypothetical protein
LTDRERGTRVGRDALDLARRDLDGHDGAASTSAGRFSSLGPEGVFRALHFTPADAAIVLGHVSRRGGYAAILYRLFGPGDEP